MNHNVDEKQMLARVWRWTKSEYWLNVVRKKTSKKGSVGHYCCVIVKVFLCARSIMKFLWILSLFCLLCRENQWRINFIAVSNWKESTVITLSQETSQTFMNVTLKRCFGGVFDPLQRIPPHPAAATLLDTSLTLILQSKMFFVI